MPWSLADGGELGNGPAAAGLVGDFRAIYENAATPIVIFDDDGRYIDANEAACALLGLVRADLGKRHVDDVVREDDEDRARRSWERFRETGVLTGEFDADLPTRSGVRIRYSATANVLPGLHMAVFLPQRTAGRGDATIVLTGREREVLLLIAAGLESREIAERLSVSLTTVRSHVANAMRKLGARTRAQAVAIAFRAGELPA